METGWWGLLGGLLLGTILWVAGRRVIVAHRRRQVIAGRLRGLHPGG